MKFIKTYEALFGLDLISLLKPAYIMIQNDDEVETIKVEIINALDEYKDYLIDFVQNKYNKETQIEEDTNRISNELDTDITKELNLVSFLRTVSNILNIPKKKGEYKIEDIFEKFYDTLDERIERCLYMIESGIKPEHPGDEPDDDTSVLDRGEYMDELRLLQAELNKLVEDVVTNKKRVAIIFEGRDSAGKGSTIKRFTHYMNPKYYRIVTKGIPTKEEMIGDNWFKRYESDMPKEGEIVFFDRSYYGMCLVNPTMGYATEEQYRYFMGHVNQFEEKLVEEGIILIKLWFSISKEKQLQRFELRKNSPLKYWKYSPNDEKSLDKWDLFTKYKEQCLLKTSTNYAPWAIVQSNDKRLSQLNSIRYVLNKVEYDRKDNSNIGDTYPDVIYEVK